MARTTYIFDGREWYLTGREALKDLKRSGKTKKMVEIRMIEAPADDEDKSFNRWVFFDDLYAVTGD